MRSTLYSQVHVVPALAQASRTANATVNGTTVDTGLFGNDFKVVLFAIQAGAITDGSHAFAVQDSADGSSWAAADSVLVQGSAPTLVAASDDAVHYLGYIVANRQYVRLTVTTSGSTSGGVFGAVAVLGQPSSTPVIRS